MSIETLLDALLVPPVPPIDINGGTLDATKTKAGSPSSLGSPCKQTTLDDALAIATDGLPLTPLEVHNALSPENIEEWHSGWVDTKMLAGFARLLVQRREMDMGIVPAHFTQRATCKQCGPVWLPFTKDVLACPWCWNRASDKPIPRPRSIHCGNCIHFKRTNHSHLGHCAKGEPEAIAGLWDTDRRKCDFYVPTPKPSIKS